MSQQPAVDPRPHLDAVAAAAARPGQPEALFRALDAATGAVIGHTLFTVLVYRPASGESERRYTNQPAAYPVGGRKPLPRSAWADRLFRERLPSIGRTAADIRAVFADHELILSLGCASVINIPVVYDGQTLGTINLLHREAWYDDADIPIAQLFAALAIPAYLTAIS
jgi:GAF domain-containing protein